MPDDRKPDLNLDDWDSIPLDPDADDWDVPPAQVPSPQPPDTGGPETIELNIDSLSSQIPGFSDPFQRSPAADSAEPRDAGMESPGGPEDAMPATNAYDDFDDILAGIDAANPGVPQAAADSGGTAAATDFFETDAAIEAPSSRLEETIPLPAAKPDNELAGGFDRDESELPSDEFDAHLGAMNIDEAFAALEERGQPEPPPVPPPVPEPDLDFGELTTKKVELDIDGIFLEGTRAEASLVEDEPPPEPEKRPEPEPPPMKVPPPAPAEKKIPKIKLLVIVVPAVLALLFLVFGLWKFFYSADDVAQNPALIIDPRVPPRDPVPGELPLESFYVAFPGAQGETLVEITVVLHYNDLPDKMIVEERMVMVRDLILRSIQDKGPQVISSGEIQKNLRDELTAAVNAALGRESIEHVQISQIRILH